MTRGRAGRPKHGCNHPGAGCSAGLARKACRRKAAGLTRSIHMFANRPYSFARLRFHSSWPAKSKAAKSPVANMTEDPLPVGRRRGRSGIVEALLSVALGHDLPPAHLAGLSIQAKQEQPLLLVRAGDENAILPNHRRRAAVPRQRRYPGHVFRLAPLGRQILLRSRAVETRPPPLGPVLGPARGADEQRQARAGKRGPARTANKSATQFNHPAKVGSPTKSGKAFGPTPFCLRPSFFSLRLPVAEMEPWGSLGVALPWL